MAKGYRSTEYMYGSARIRALEARMLGRERIAHFAEAESAQTVILSLFEYGFEIKRRESGEIDREATLMTALEAGYREIEDMECEETVAFLRYPYDCNNIKAIIKCFARGIEPDGMMISVGSIDADRLKKAFEDKDHSCLPRNMATAIPEAMEAFSATKDPQKIDFILDRACYADMLLAAKESGIPLAMRLVRTKIDLTNLLIAVRLMRMNYRNTVMSLFDEAYLEGGELGKEFFADLLEGESELAKRLEYTPYEPMGALLAERASLGALEKKADDIYSSVAAESKYAPFGAEVLIGYIVALEYAVKNMRIILAGKDAHLSSDIIRERLRECYV